MTINVLALASEQCRLCAGNGIDQDNTCACVLKEVFRCVYKRWQEMARRPKHQSQTSIVRIQGAVNKVSFGRKTEEFLADFVTMSFRVLGGRDTLDGKLFNFHYLLGADPALICRQFGIDARAFYLRRSSIIMRLASAYINTKPYGLYPLDEYFATVIDGRTPASVVCIDHFKPVRPPLRPAA